MHVKKTDLEALAHGLIAYADTHAPTQGATVVALTGDLGAGKTTLVQHVARALGVETLVPSPTFVIMRSYKTKHVRFKRLVHIDAYRLEEETELRALHLTEVFADPETLVCVEWPERLFGTLPIERIDIALTVVDEDTRELTGSSEVEGIYRK